MRIAFTQADVMRVPLAACSVHAIVCSPPYYGLREYATDDLKEYELGAEPHPDCLGWATGDPCGECFVCHVRQYAAEFWRVLRDDGTWWLNLGDSYAGSGGAGEWSKRKAGKQEYAGPRNNANRTVKSKRVPRGKGSGRWGGGDVKVKGIPAKNLIGLPWRVALALQADGWTLRAAPPWIKGNPMPESTKDRPNTAHEYWFMLTKGKKYNYDMEAVKQESTGQTGRAAGFIRENPGPDVPGQQAKQHRKSRKEHVPDGYFSDMESVRVGYEKPLDRWGGDTKKTTDNLKGEDNPYQLAHRERDMRPNKAGRHWRTNDFSRVGLQSKLAAHKEYVSHLEAVLADGGMLFDESGMPEAMFFNTKGYGGAHFATFNSDMIEPLIKFSTSEKGVCPKCGNPWVRIIEKGYRAPVDEEKIAEMEAKGVPRQKANLYGHNTREPANYAEDPDKTTGWRPTCSHYDHLYKEEFAKARSARKRHQRNISGDWWKRVRKRAGLPHWEVNPAIVADFFSGSGTTAMVANQLGRIGIGLELSMEYIDLARERTGLRALAAWEGGRPADSGGLAGLPMFEELK